MKLRQKMAQEYKLDPKAFWIAGMGTVTKRKGADIFIEVAIRLNVEDPNIHLIWIGGFPDVQMKADLEEKIQCQKLRNITFTGPVPYDLHTLKPFDLFLLTSREDPYPLVVIEAAYNKVPTLCFEKSGGIPEFVNKDSGWIAEELSVDKMVESILKIVKDSDQIKRKGESAYEKALRWHADEEAVLNAFQEIIQNVKRTK